MDPDKTLEFARTMVLAWEQAANTDAEHAAARELSSAFSALDDWLSHGGRPPADWSGGRETGGSVLTMVREFVAACDEAMKAEDISTLDRARITNRLLWGNPGGAAGIAAEAEAARTATQAMDSGGSSVWHLITGNPVAPSLTQPVFGGDFREIPIESIDHEDVHPLIATCACGEEIMRDAPDQEWQHSDARV